MRDYESVQMWQRYIKGDEGVAVQSTYERLVSSFPEFDGREQQRNVDGTNRHLFVRIGMVTYIDYETYRGPIEALYLFKRREFEDEHEVRAVVMDWALVKEGRPTRFPTGGSYVPVDLARLIQAIYLAPGVSQWLREAIESCVKRYGFDFPIRQSHLDRKPFR